MIEVPTITRNKWYRDKKTMYCQLKKNYKFDYILNFAVHSCCLNSLRLKIGYG